MAFLGGLFKKKPGGTVIGNLVRGVANNLSGGILGTGAGIITQEQADMKDLSDADFQAKYGKTKQGVPVAGSPTTPVNSGVATEPKETFSDKMKMFFQLKWVRVVGAILGSVLLIWLFVKLYRKYGKKRRRY